MRRLWGVGFLFEGRGGGFSGGKSLRSDEGDDVGIGDVDGGEFEVRGDGER